MHDQPITKSPTQVPYMLFLFGTYLYLLPYPYTKGTKRYHEIPSGIDQFFQIDLLKRSVNTEAQSAGAHKFLTSPRYEIFSGCGGAVAGI